MSYSHLEKPSAFDKSNDAMKTENIENADTADAVLHSSKSAHTTLRSYLVTLIICIGGFMYGFSSNVISGALALPSFNAKILPIDAADRTAGLIGLFYAGGVFGAVFQQPISDRYGRRVALMSSSVFHCVGAALAAGSVHYAMFAVARFIAGIGSSMSLTLPPVFISELAPSHSRGKLVACHVVMLTTGYLISSLGSLGFSYLHGDYQWRLNFAVNTGISIVAVVLVYFVPESPRWLVSKDRVDEAAEVLRKLHTSKFDREGMVAQAELIQIQQQLEEAKHLPRGFRHVFTSPAHRKRIVCTIMVWFMAMSTGVLVIAVYSTVLFASLGYNTSGSQFGLSAGWLVCCIVSAAVGGLFVDRIGRIRMLALGGLLCALSLAVETAMQAKYLGTTNKAGNSIAVAAFFMFAVFYNGLIDAGSFVYTSEIWPNHLRSEGVTIAMVTFYLTNLVWSTPAPVALQTLDWRFYIIFVVISVVFSTAIWWYCPETSGLTLEEVGSMFGEEMPKQHLGEKRNETLTGRKQDLE